jgi:N utilization substance protein A
VLLVVENVEIASEQVTLEQGKFIDKSAKIGDLLHDPLPPIDFGRVSAQTAKQVIVQKVKEADKERQYQEFKDKAGQITSGIVKRVEYGNIYLDLGKAEAYMRKDDTVPRERGSMTVDEFQDALDKAGLEGNSVIDSLVGNLVDKKF